MISLKKPIEFEWDEGNEGKNWKKHAVSMQEAEQVFFNENCLIASDVTHSQQEPRYIAVGSTNTMRTLFVAFTVRKQRIRIISARDLNKREWKLLKGKL